MSPVVGQSSKLPAHVRDEVKRILEAEAQRLLAEGFSRDASGALRKG